jgi:hypothetical protein
MKIIKGLAFFVVTIIFGSCFDPPKYPVVPEIEFEKIEFVDRAFPLGDSLFLYLNFKDGDGDLGLDAENPSHRSFPYHDAVFFQGNNGVLNGLNTYSLSIQMQDIIDIPNPNQGKLVFPRTRKKTGFSNLPAYQPPNTCTVYNFRKILIEGEDLNVIKTNDLSKFDPSIKFTDTISFQGRRFYEIEDTLYFNVNPDHYNIEVDFLVKDPGKPGADAEGFVEYDWRLANCGQNGTVGQTYDARFTILSDRSGPLEGTLRYTMNSLDFTSTFSIRTLKLRVQIKDRALNRSNTITTPEFTLDKIRKK